MEQDSDLTQRRTFRMTARNTTDLAFLRQSLGCADDSEALRAIISRMADEKRRAATAQ